MKNRIYYFTGTGNSMRAAQKIGSRLGNCEIVSMKGNPDENPAEDCEVVGFIFPVYHWTMPETAAEFVKKLKINPQAYIFCVAMPSFVCGEACEALERILAEKGIKIDYGTKIYNVANYAIVYPPLPSPKVVIPKTERKLDKIAEEITLRKKQSIPHSNPVVRLKIKGMAKYKAVVKKADYGFKIKNDCVGCGLCSKVCPTGNIVIKDGRPHFSHNCAQCMACVSYCPKRAIGYKLTDRDFEKMEVDPSDFRIAKIMGLPKNRKPYHHPNISATDLMKNKAEL